MQDLFGSFKNQKEDAPKKIKRKWGKRYKAMFDMGQEDYLRYSQLLARADVLRFNVNRNDVLSLRPYFSILDTIYNNLTPVAFETKKKDLDDEFDKVEKALISFEQSGEMDIPHALLKRLRSLHRELLMLRQVMGMGIPVEEHRDNFDEFEEDLLGAL